jgi:hypothetical protein
MKAFLTWKKGIFKRAHEFYDGDKLVGTMKDRTWSQIVDASMNGKNYCFVTKGFFKRETSIVNPENDQVYGIITYKTWRRKATISYSNKEVFWEYENFWNTKWSIYDTNGTKVHYFGRNASGEIECNEQNDVLILAGMFIRNYYQKAASNAAAAT